jgi:adenosylmethionine-8-amino-7-oxononanoate aminotransferase
LEKALEEHGKNTAGVILEPLLQGAAGMNFHSADFVKATRHLCDAHNTFFIADEVATAWGRLGSLLACDFAQVRPDFLCLSKGLSGGILPLSLTVTHEAIFDLFKSPSRADAFFHGHTFTANPIACHSANVSMQLYQQKNLPKRFIAIGDIILENIADEAKNHPQIEVRHQGAIIALALKEKDAGYLSGIGEKLRAACLAHNEVLLRPLGSVLYTFPPACTTDEEAAKIGQALSEIALSAFN